MDRRKFLQKISVVAAVPVGLLAETGEVTRAEPARKRAPFGGGPRAQGALPKGLRGEALRDQVQRLGPFNP